MKRVLVVRCGALGDLVYATSVIDALRLEYGADTVIDFVCTPGSGTLFQKDPRVNRVFPLKHKKIPILLSKEKRNIIETSKKSPYDILINFEYGKQFRSLLEAIDAKKKVGAQLSDPSIDPNARHMVEIIKELYKEIVSHRTFQKSFPRLIGTPKEETIQKYSLPKSYLIISPSNSHQKRNRINYRAWENNKWKELVKQTAAKIPVVIIGAPNEEEFFQKLRPFPENVIDLVGKTPISDLIGVIEASSGLIATDTGTAHIASALRTPVYALIGPTPADVTGPYKTPENEVYIISSHLPCSPCYKTEVMKRCKDNICMKQISVPMILDVLESHLQLH